MSELLDNHGASKPSWPQAGNVYDMYLNGGEQIRMKVDRFWWTPDQRLLTVEGRSYRGVGEGSEATVVLHGPNIICWQQIEAEAGR